VVIRKKWRCRLRQTFFGLTDDYNEGVYEQIFFLKYTGGWSFSEIYNLPVGLRNWFVKRTVKQLEDEAQAIKEASNGGGNSQTLTVHNQPKMPKTF